MILLVTISKLHIASLRHIGLRYSPSHSLTYCSQVKDVSFSLGVKSLDPCNMEQNVALSRSNSNNNNSFDMAATQRPTSLVSTDAMTYPFLQFPTNIGLEVNYQGGNKHFTVILLSIVLVCWLIDLFFCLMVFYDLCMIYIGRYIHQHNNRFH